MSNGIIKLCSRIVFDEDTDTNESVCGILSNAEELRVKIVVVENAGEPFGDNINSWSSDPYGCFDCVKDQKGIYIFQKKNTGEVLYAGRSGFEGSQHLDKRVKQHYQKGSGANFRINWAKCNCWCKKTAQAKVMAVSAVTWI